MYAFEYQRAKSVADATAAIAKSGGKALAGGQSLVGAMGQGGVDSFARVYMAPGMQHCSGGVGPDSFGENGPWPGAKDPHQSLQLSIEQWVEKGTPPNDIVATKFSGPLNSGRAEMTRPLCVYPNVAKYKGSGDENDASNFSCEDEHK